MIDIRLNNDHWTFSRKMKKLLPSFLMLSLVFLLVGCINTPSSKLKALNENFSERFPLTDVNTSIQLSLYDEVKTFKANSNIPFYIQNESNYSILIDENVDTNLFVADGSEWVEIENAIIYSDSLPLSPLGTPLLDFRYTWVLPVMNRDVMDITSEDVLLRIFVVGDIVKDGQGSGEFVGAYLDVFLTGTE